MGLTGFEKIDLTGIEGVCLDLDNTLYAYEPCHLSAESAVLQDIANHFMLPSMEVEAHWNRAKREVKQVLGATASSHSRLLYLARLIESVKGAAHPELALKWEELYWSVFLDSMQPAPEAKNFISSCQQNDVPIALVTDLTLQIQLRKVIKLGLSDSFRWIISSEEAGFDKPDKRFVEQVLKRTGFKENKHIWVGDSTEKDGGSALLAKAKFYLVQLPANA